MQCIITHCQAGKEVMDGVNGVRQICATPVPYKRDLRARSMRTGHPLIESREQAAPHMEASGEFSRG